MRGIVTEMLKLHKLWFIIPVIVAMLFVPEQASAQEPPFDFELTPSFSEGKLTYRINFDLETKKINGLMTNVNFKIPIPEGTRFVEANAQASTAVSFDGSNVNFFTSSMINLGLTRRSTRVVIRDAWFVVEVVEPARGVFKTSALITWEGDQPGSYQTEEFSYDTTRPVLDWSPPPSSALEVELSATSVDGLITYFIRPANVGSSRMWDLRLNLLIPEGVTFQSAEAPPGFVHEFNGQEVSFFTSELPGDFNLEPLTVKVSATDVTTPEVISNVWATWKNADRSVGIQTPAQGAYRTGDIIVRPGSSQWVIADPVGDVPFLNYDTTSMALQEEGSHLRVDFYMAGDLGPPASLIEYILYIDSDCNKDTGQSRKGRGVEYRIRYEHGPDETPADIRFWNEAEKEWQNKKYLLSQINNKMISIWVPYDVLANGRQFCWLGRMLNSDNTYNAPLPDEYIESTALTQYQAVGTNAMSESVIPVSDEVPAPGEAQADNSSRSRAHRRGVFIEVGDVWQYLPGWSEPPSAWKSVDFDSSDWLTGTTPMGYGRGKYTTDLSTVTPLASLYDTPILVEQTITDTGVTIASLPTGQTDSVYLRRTFQVEDPAIITELTLRINYRSGFVAYLNGREVARRGLGEPGSPLSYNTLAEKAEKQLSEYFDLSEQAGQLVAGTNVLAIQAHRGQDDSNLFVAPLLRWRNNSQNGTEAEVVTEEAPAQQPPPPSLPPPSQPVAATVPPPPSAPAIKGKLAVPLDNGWNTYDTHIFSLPDGQEIAKITNARQPNLRFDGQRLLVNREGGGLENIYEYDLANGTERQVSDAPRDSYPFYDVGGNRVIYGNAELLIAADGQHRPFIFVQCGLQPPHQEEELQCREMVQFGVLIPTGQTGEIIGSHPVWTVDDRVIYKGCNSWLNSSVCGIYAVSAMSTRRFGDGYTPQQLTQYMSDVPTDTKGGLIAFTSQRDGDWEAYIMDSNGGNVRNVSNSPTSNDGLPTISPDGQWIAFVSDKGGLWAVWAAPASGGPAQKLFDLPDQDPWGEDDRNWLNERISWGP